MKRLLSCVLSLLLGLNGSLWAASEVDVVALKRVATYGRNTVTAGTEEALAADTPVKSCCVKALATNTGNVYIGGNASVTSSNGYVLAASAALCLDVDSPADIYIDVDTNTEGVSYICVR